MPRPVTTNPNVMHGAPCFVGTRVTVRSLFDHLESGYSIDEFLEQFPSVKRDQVVQLLEDLKVRAEQDASPVGQ